MMVCMARSLVEVELLLVPDCPHAQPAEELLSSALRAAGLGSTPIRVSVIDSQRAAELRGFVGSPTILINGHDPFAEPGRPPALACRVYPGPSDPAGLPPAEQLRAALAAAASTSQHRTRREPKRRA
jgi:hypothetical protein